MKRLSTIAGLLCAILFLSSEAMFAQLTGTKTIPGDYATITAAVADLNSVGVGASGVTFNVAAGYTETSANILVTATGTASNPILFQKSGAGANPLITASAGVSTTLDGIIVLSGSDYLTFDGIDLTDPATNATATTQMEWGYALLKSSATNGAQNVTIKNCVVTLQRIYGSSVGIYSANHTSASTTSLTVTDVAGANSNNRFFFNTIVNVNTGIYLTGFADAAAPYTYYDQSNDVGGSSAGTGNTIQNYGGVSATTAYGIRLVYQNNANVSYNSINNLTGGGIVSVSTLYGIIHSIGINSNATINNNTVSLGQGSTTSSVFGINSAITGTGTVSMNNNTVQNCSIAGSSSVFSGLYNSGSPATININNNNIINNTALNTTGTVQAIYNNTASVTINCTGNTITGNRKTGASGTLYGYYNNGSPTSGLETISNNTISNNSVAGTGTFYGMLTTPSSTQSKVISGNTVANDTAGSGSAYGIHSTLGNTSDIYSNNVSVLRGGGTIYGISASSSSTVSANTYSNTVSDLSSTGTSSVAYGIYLGGGTTVNAYKNKAYNVTENGTGGTVYGMYLSSGTAALIYNNFVSDLKTPAATGTIAIGGIYVAGGTTVGLYFNSVFINATSASVTTFGTTGIYGSTTPTLELRNNIAVNLSTPGPTGGFTVGYRRSGTTLTSYASASNNNDFYVNTGAGVRRYFYAQGTTPADCDSTFAAFKTRVTPRDANSFAENPPFLNAAGAPYDLHMQTGTPTQTESGGSTVSTPIAITTDYDGDTRNASTPDIGADEFAGTPAPNMTYTSSTTEQVTGSAYIGVNQSVIRVQIVTSGSLNPLTLTQLTLNANGTTAIGNINATPARVYYTGGSTTFSTSTLFGSATPTIADFNVTGSQNLSEGNNYFWLAYDVNGGAGNVIDGECTSMIVSTVTRTPGTTAPAGNKTIVGALSGDYTVGVALFNKTLGRNIYPSIKMRLVEKDVAVETPETKSTQSSPSIERKQVEEHYVVWMENGREYAGPLGTPTGIYATITAAVSDVVLRGVSGAVRFLLTDASYAETFPIIIAPIAGTSGTNTVTIRPNTGVTTTISGSSTSSIFKLDGAEYIIFDGSNSGGTDRNMTVTNTSTSSATAGFWLASAGAGAGATNNVIKNCNISCGVDQSTGASTTFGILTAGSAVSTTSDGTDNNSNSFTNNALTTVRYGIYLRGSSTSSNSGNSVTQNLIGPSAFGAAEIGKAGVILQYQTGATVSQNEVRFVGGTYATTSGGADRIGIGVGSESWSPTATTVTNTSVTRNLIHDIVEARTFSSAAIVLAGSGTPSSNMVANNVIYNILANGTAGDQAIGIGIGSGDGDKVLFNSISMQGNLDGNGGTSNASQSGVGIRIASTTPLNLLLKNNVVSVDLTTTTTTINHYDIVAPATSYAWGTGGADYNDYFFNAGNTQMKLGGIGTSVPYTAVADLATWKTQFTPAQDANSISGDPLFSGPTNLVPFLGSPVLDAGVAGTGVTVDYTGATRVDPPSMGAYETGAAAGPPSCATIVSPADAAVNVAITATLNWGNGGGGPTGYKLYFGTDNPPTNIVNGTNLGAVLTYDPTPDMQYSTVYYWKIVPTNGNGDATGCTIWSFTTASDPNWGGGGAGTGGYYYANSTPDASGAPSQPGYGWVDPIGSGHTQITDAMWLGGATNPGDDGYFGPVPLGFSFTYFGTAYTELYVGTNGVIRFGAPMYRAAYGPVTFPNAADTNRNTVAVVWMDVDTRASVYPAAGVYYGGDASQFVVTWRNIHDYASLTDSITCQAIFFPNGNIKMQYNDLLSTIPLPASINNDLISGIENGDGTFGIGYRVNGTGGPVISSPVAVEFGTNQNALPIVLSSFTGQANQSGGIRIDWTTTSETNNYGFYVQRRLEGTQEWSTVSNLIPGYGTTLEPHSYSFIDHSVTAPGSYQYRLRQMDLDGTAHHVDPITIAFGTTDVVETAPREFSLKQNYPNPFNPETVIKFSVENSARATLDVYNLLGQKVATLFNDVAEAGQYYNVRLNGTALASGMYIYRLQSGTRTDVKKMLLLK